MEIIFKPTEEMVDEIIESMTDNQIKKIGKRLGEIQKNRLNRLPEGKKIFNVSESCKYLGCSDYYFRKWRGEFQFLKRTPTTGNTFSIEELEKLRKLVYEK